MQRYYIFMIYNITISRYFHIWIQKKDLIFQISSLLSFWRKLGDSNPRDCYPYVSLANWWFQPLTQTSFLRGSWRIRTAVHGFADRWLSHSSKEPIFHYSHASFVSRLRMQRYDYFLNLQAFRWKISRKSLFFFIRTLFSMSVTSTWTPLTLGVTTPNSLETEDSPSYNPHYTKQKNDSNDYFLKIHK